VAMATIAVPLLPALLSGAARLIRALGPPASVRSR
jgi:hypothetical protein